MIAAVFFVIGMVWLVVSHYRNRVPATITITDHATGQSFTYLFDTPVIEIPEQHREIFEQQHEHTTQQWAQEAQQVPAWAARNGANGMHQGVPTFPIGSQHSATPTFHPSTGQQNGIRTYQNQGFGQRHYGGSYTNHGTYYYDPNNVAIVRDWRDRG